MVKHKIIGQNYLHPHPVMQDVNDIDKDHVIVDRDEWEEVISFFKDNPGLIQYIGKGKIEYDSLNFNKR